MSEAHTEEQDDGEGKFRVPITLAITSGREEYLERAERVFRAAGYDIERDPVGVPTSRGHVAVLRAGPKMPVSLLNRLTEEGHLVAADSDETNTVRFTITDEGIRELWPYVGWRAPMKLAEEVDAAWLQVFDWARQDVLDMELYVENDQDACNQLDGLCTAMDLPRNSTTVKPRFGWQGYSNPNLEAA